jgi:hypothetical protein
LDVIISPTSRVRTKKRQEKVSLRAFHIKAIDILKGEELKTRFSVVIRVGEEVAVVSSIS